MKQLEYLKGIYDKMSNTDKDVLNKSLADCHVKGLFSLVIDGTEHGKLTRVFIANKKIKPFQIQLHSHRYGIRLTPIQGQITEYKFDNIQENFNSSLFEYKSPLNGGNGLEYLQDIKGSVFRNDLPIGVSTFMNDDDIHTISCSKSSIWIVEEKGFTTERSLVVGVPFVTDNLYNNPKQFEINDNFVKVKRVLKEIIESYYK